MRPDRPVKKVSTELDVLRFPAPAEAPKGPDCLNCSSPLTLSQPDLDSPDRLIGVCGRCKHWFLIDLIPDRGEGIMSRLPDHQVIRSLSHEDPSSEGVSIKSPDLEGGSPQAEGTAGRPDALPWTEY